MFAVSTVHIGLSIEGFYTSYLKTPQRSSGVGTDPSCITKLYLPAINFMLSDAIVTWRAYVLWGFNRKVCIVPCILVLATGVVAIIGVQQSAAHMATVQLTASYPWDLAMNCLTLATNVITTGLVTCRGRRYFVQNRVALGSDVSKRSKAIFYLLIESGFLYCFTWVLFFIVYWSGPHGNFLTTDIISQLTGIYSTLIVVLVALKKTQADSVGVDQTVTDTFDDSDIAVRHEHGTTTGSAVLTTTVSSARGLSGRGQPVMIHITNTVERDRGDLKNITLVPQRLQQV